MSGATALKARLTAPPWRAGGEAPGGGGGAQTPPALPPAAGAALGALAAAHARLRTPPRAPRDARAAAARPVARRSRGDRAGRDRRLHDAPPTRARRARLLPRGDASRGEPRALRLALHARRHLPRRDVRSVSAPGSKKRRPTPRPHLQYLSRRVPDFPDWHQGQATISSRGPRRLGLVRTRGAALVNRLPGGPLGKGAARPDAVRRHPGLQRAWHDRGASVAGPAGRPREGGDRRRRPVARRATPA